MEAGTVAVICLALMTVEVRGVPFQFTTALPLKLLPFTVIAKAGLPEFAESGLSCEMAGTLPAVGGAAAFLLYPQATVRAISKEIEIALIVFMVFSQGLMAH
jgi:hypothetical protein